MYTIFRTHDMTEAHKMLYNIFDSNNDLRLIYTVNTPKGVTLVAHAITESFTEDTTKLRCIKGE